MQQIANLSAEVQKRWDDWLDARVHAHINDFADLFAKMMGREVGQIKRQLREEIKRAIAEDVRFPIIQGWTPNRMYCRATSSSLAVERTKRRSTRIAHPDLVIGSVLRHPDTTAKTDAATVKTDAASVAALLTYLIFERSVTAMANDNRSARAVDQALGDLPVNDRIAALVVSLITRKPQSVRAALSLLSMISILVKFTELSPAERIGLAEYARGLPDEIEHSRQAIKV